MKDSLPRVGVVECVVGGLVAAVFAVDLAMPFGPSVWLLYFIPLFLTLRSGYARLAFLVAGAAVVLMFVALAFSFPGETGPWLSVCRRLLGAAVLSCAAILLVQHKRTEAALRVSETRYRLVSEGGSDVIWLFDLELNRFSFVSRSVERLRGFSVEEVLHQDMQDALTPESYRMVAAGLPSRLAAFEAGDDSVRIQVHEVDQTRKDGSVISTEVVTTLVADERRHVTHIQGVTRDITERKRAEKDREESARMLREVIDLVPHHIFAKDRDGRYMLANRVAAQCIGRNPEELVGRREIDFSLNKDFTEAFLKDDREVIDTGRSKFIPEEPIIYADGSTRWLQTSKMAFTPPGSSERAVLGVAVDITELKKAEAAIHQSEEEFRSIFNTVSIGMAQADPMTGRFLRVNRKMCIITGYSEAELLQMSVPDVTYSEDRNVDWDHFQRVVNGQASEYRIEKRYVRKDGSLAWVSVNMTVVCDRQGRRLHTMATIEDISHRKRVEEEHARLAQVVDQAAETIVIADLDGNINYANASFERTTGYTRVEALGKNPRMLQSGKQDKSFYKLLWDTLTRGEVWRGHFTNKRKDGSYYEEDAVISPVRNPAGHITGYAAVKRDVTREMQLETQIRQSQKMEAVGLLAGGVAHDFNNILQAIFGFCDILLANLASSDPNRRDVVEIQKSASHAKSLTRQLLAFSRRQLITPTILDLNQVVATTEKMLLRLIGEDIRIEKSLAPDLRRIKADAGNIEQVIMNLVVNARDAMPRGGRLTIKTFNIVIDQAVASANPDAYPGEFVCLAISDTGCGMTREILQRIFEPFFTTKGPEKGTGLGLSVIYGIIKQHEGWISVFSSPGLGTTFKIHLPAYAIETGARTLVAPEETPGAKPGNGERILLVEDEQLVSLVILRFLKTAGYEVQLATSVTSAHELFQNERGRFDLLLTDVVLPDGNGIDLAVRLRTLNPSLAVLLSSGYTDERARIADARDRGYHFIPKPYVSSELNTAIRNTLIDRTRRN